MGARTVVRCVATLVVALVVAVGLVPTAASAAGTGSISGVVTDEGGAPVEGAELTLYPGPVVLTTTTDASGAFTFAGLDPNQYRIQVVHPDFVRSFHDGSLSASDADPIVLADGEAVTGLAIELDDGQSISGTVAHRDGDPLDPTPHYVCARDPATLYSRCVDVEPSGAYEVPALPPGSYTVEFQGAGTVIYFPDVTDVGDATLVAVVDGSDTTGIDGVVGTLAAVEGRVTDPDGAPIEGALVRLVRPMLGVWDATFTDADGEYRFGRLTHPDWHVYVDAEGFHREWYDDVPDGGTPTVATTTATAPTTGIDAVLTPIEYGSIAGTVTLADGTAPFSGEVCANRIGFEQQLCGDIGVDGTYRIDGLEVGDHLVRFGACADEPCDVWFEEYYDDAVDWSTATLVPVTADTVTPDVDAVLGQGLYGQVVDGLGDPVEGAIVAAYTDTDGWLPTGWATTDADGWFQATDLPAGSYRLAIVPPSGSGLAQRWYDSSTGTRSGATPVGVEAATYGTYVEVVLGDAGSLAGTVTYSTGGVVEGATVAAYADGDAWVPSAVATTAADGTYAFAELPPGDYRLVVGPPAGAPSRAVWVGGTGRADATVHQVTAGGSITGADAVLPYETTVAGTVHHEGGAAAEGATVSAYGSTDVWMASATVTVAADGTFSFQGLPADTYRLLVKAPAGNGETTLTQYWHAEPGITDRRRAAAATIELDPSEQIAGITVVHPAS